MDHVVIIGGNGQAVDLLEEKLWNAGHHSILAVRDTDEAKMLSRILVPTLFVALPDALERAGERLQDLSEMTGAPIIVATADPALACKALGPSATLQGPYPVNAIGQAEAAARKARSNLADAA